MVGLGDLVGGDFDSVAWDVSGDGSVIVGYGTGTNGDEAFRWSSEVGMESLSNVLNAQGDDLSHWQVLKRAYAVSADGSTIVGWGINIDGSEEGFVATITSVPEPTSMSILGLGLCFTLFARRRRSAGAN